MSLLEEVQVDLVVDVRSIPRSRTNPQFNLDVLPEALAAAGIGYRHLPFPAITPFGWEPRSIHLGRGFFHAWRLFARRSTAFFLV
jgi:uncharacterized protein (DUF488 family)